MNPRLNSSVSVVRLNDRLLEFFLTNTRQHLRIKVENDIIFNIVTTLDGLRSANEIAKEYDIDIDELTALLDFLRSRGVLDNVTPKDDFPEYASFRRVIHFLAEYSHSHDHLMEMWAAVRKASVLIVGLGAVGTWVAANLAQTGVGKIIIMDGDVVDETNLHRQFGYCESDIGRKKIDVLEERLYSISKTVQVVKDFSFLNSTALNVFDNTPIDLIINCADKPTVDDTSLWIGEYAMKRGIPHIVGGGYNLHLSLIGQTVLPGKTACVKCFQKTLEEENTIDSTKVKKLAVKNRKVGSFGPMCSLISSMVGMEAIKVLARDIAPSNINRRGEFDIFTMDIKYKNFSRRDDCEWCGKNGMYYRL